MQKWKFAEYDRKSENMEKILVYKGLTPAYNGIIRRGLTPTGRVDRRGGLLPSCKAPPRRRADGRGTGTHHTL